jgi:predicted nucleic acid-binding protein
VRFVLDASAAVRLIMRMDDALWLADRLDGASLVLVPGLFRTEVANALWKYVRAGQLSADDALRRLDEALALGDAEVPDADLLTEALASACRTGHPVYDQLYVILARRHAARLLTRDRRLAELAGQLGVELVL